MGVSKNRGTPKWMVKIMENPIKVDDLGGKPTILGSTQMDGWKPSLSASPFGDGFGTEEGAQGADRTDEPRRRLRW